MGTSRREAGRAAPAAGGGPEGRRVGARVCRIPAHAKINLSLEILGRRPDGYHELRSVVVPIELCDDVEVALLARGGGGGAGMGAVSVSVVPCGVDCSAVGPPEGNLCAKAAGVFWGRLAPSARRRGGGGVRIRIAKRIPVGGGLGGGSADAAATLAALNALFAGGGGAPPPFSPAELVALAAEVGSDVPALTLGGTVLMEGRGERVTRLEGFAPPFDLLLANPGVHVSTVAAYRAFDEALTKPGFSSNILSSRNRGGTLSDFSAMLSNGLEGPVFALCPEVAQIAALLKDAGAAGVRMSGSGATVFALAESPAAAGALAEALPAGCWRAVSRTMPDGVMAAHGPLEA